MKTSLLLAGLLVLLSTGSYPLKAQSDQGAADRAKMLSFLSPGDKERFLAARQKAMTDNPGLKTEGETLRAQGKTIHGDGSTASPEEKQAFFEKFMAYQQKLRQAMLKEDSTLQPIFNQIDQHLSQARAKHEAATGGSASSTSTNAAPMAPSGK